MKNLYVAGLIIVLAFSGCTAQIEEDVSEEVEVEQTVFVTSEDKQLVNTSSYASCFQVQLQDLKGNLIDIPQEIRDSFDCFGAATTLSSNGDYLVYDHNNRDENSVDLKLYNFETEETLPLMIFASGVEGLKCIWNDLSDRIACAAVNQEVYEGSTKLIVYKLEDGNLVDTQEFAQTYEEMFDFTCGGECYPGNFWFENENTIKYKGHNIIAPEQEFEIKF